MASTQARQNARARARAAQQKVLVDRKRRDDANMTSLTAFFTAAEQIDAAQLAMARALDAIRTREGTLGAAATLAGITTGEARKLLALLAENTATTSTTATGDSNSGNELDAPGPAMQLVATTVEGDTVDGDRESSTVERQD
ncbi:hypothetical protein [Rhodococcus sp. H29-C3]|uniref:hypothetical protein n=1 Tax=Rhodococcus sp. H29-C3 TaxID=3046307 RepID=UPI0024B960D6|nr:hypothetical protein [Rhodococcus sp. H29-C3]MDJ0362754.1 hypothetical protein [Rhodococcus sp. H29-C3]